jgi:FkbM family methyltransferase
MEWEFRSIAIWKRKRFFDWVPLAKPLPLKDFPQRLIRKCFFVLQGYLFILRYGPGISRAKKLGISPDGNALLQLKKESALGPKGSILELPQDQQIFETVQKLGSWALEESIFLAEGLRKAEGLPNSKTALLDIGAHCGLVTLQAMNLSKTKNEIFLFEPLPRHSVAIKHNLRNLPNVHNNNFGLSNKNSNSEIFTEITNYGNTSLFQTLVPESKQIKTSIKLVGVIEYCEKFLNRFDSYVIKCDTQGMDALILSRIPLRIWQNTVAAVIEIWAVPEVSEIDVTNLLAKIQSFEHGRWHPKSAKKVDFNEVGEFWMSKTGQSRNLFLSRNI